MGKENVREKSTYDDSEIWIEMLPAKFSEVRIV